MNTRGGGQGGWVTYLSWDLKCREEHSRQREQLGQRLCSWGEQSE